LRHGHAGIQRLLREKVLALHEPFLEVLEAPHVREGEARRNELEDAVLAGRLLLLGENLEVGLVVENRPAREDPRNDVLRFVLRQALERHGESFYVRVREALLAEVALPEVTQKEKDLALVREVVVKNVDLLLQV